MQELSSQLSLWNRPNLHENFHYLFRVKLLTSGLSCNYFCSNLTTTSILSLVDFMKNLIAGRENNFYSAKTEGLFSNVRILGLNKELESIGKELTLFAFCNLSFLTVVFTSCKCFIFIFKEISRVCTNDEKKVKR